MLHLVLVEPEIAPNVGNIARLCAATGTMLHLVGRLGFRLDDKSLRRAGLDYWPSVLCKRSDSIESFLAGFKGRIICFSAHASRPYSDIRYQDEDALVFGSESRGLPASLLQRSPELTVTLPMPAGKVRSLNLATAAGIGLYEALRQIGAW
jgi:tRNA (cytidine/uridine-2'-O-)-methyltransferase